tara:strand:+ start:21846 stop:22022 length:177 start_codon:yes stop_codon:yes gene_type:complete
MLNKKIAQRRITEINLRLISLDVSPKKNRASILSLESIKADLEKVFRPRNLNIAGNIG